MTVNYTTNLALGQPVTGTESGTWGDDVNNAVTSYLDIAIAGGLAVTVTTADVTLTLTQGTSSATNIGSTTAQYAILNVSGAMTAARNLIVPSSSRIYLINNNTTGGFALTVKGSATSGVTMVNGEKAHVFWNGTDYAKMSNSSGGAGVFSSITNTGLTSGRVVYTTTGGLETDSANLTFNGTTLSTAGLSDSGNLTFTGTGNRILGDFSNATASNRVIFQTSTASANTRIGMMPNAASTGTAGPVLYSTNDPDNASVFDIRITDGSQAALISTFNGTGTYLPMAFQTGGSERMRLDTSGNVGIGTSSPAATLHSYKNTANGTIGVAAILDAGTQNPSVAGGGIVMNFLTNTGVTYFGAVGGYTDGTNYVTGLWGGAAASGAPALIVNSSGNVGIGTSSPGTKLDITANPDAIGVNIRGRSADGIAVQRFADNANTETAAIDIRPSETMLLQTGSGRTSRLSLSSSGVIVPTPVGLGYGTGSGGTVTQATSRTTGVTLNKPTGAITLVSAAGSSTWQEFTVTNSLVTANDTFVLNQRAGADRYVLQVRSISAGSFVIAFQTTGGTTTEQPIFNFAIIKGATS